MKKMPEMVVIEWEDSAQAAPQWQWLTDAIPPAILKCRSVGFLIRDNKKEKALAISVASARGGEAEQASGIISIPTRCVTSIERITSSSRPPYYRAAASRRTPQAT
jgi:hypothetical protein